MGSVPST
nr:unnamed protein product [Callosobruchus chinensis]CAH7714704.1 unnamed protein product [Callosobruchus chinensis]CAH7719796.1 unnamed protein product [Callosobruchus chinensis]CAH7720435.1 unnamed protein product [Callosobruchus chinensis]CAH7740568.1 unnamed protein product [Callosobruchus chinensis]